MSLQKEIEQKSKEIHTESLSMSIGEIISMYTQDDLDIHPEFQRFYRWSNYQKSKLIESILLNIPVPPIFVAQRNDGIWDVVDGLQRLSTIFEFIGILKDQKNKIVPPLELEKTALLPSLNKKVWQTKGSNSFSDTQQRYFKRSRLDFVIIQKESDPSSKYELFQRLNTGGSSLTPQEVRNCLLIMNNEKYFDRLKILSEYQPFLDSINISDKNLDEQYDKELVSRFLVLKDKNPSELNNVTDLGSYLDDQLIQYFNSNFENWTSTESIFKRTFKLINDKAGSDAFKRYNASKDEFYGGFIVSAFEMIALGISRNIDYWEKNGDIIIDKIKACWEKINSTGVTWKGYSASGRLPKTIAIGQDIFHES